MYKGGNRKQCGSNTQRPFPRNSVGEKPFPTAGFGTTHSFNMTDFTLEEVRAVVKAQAGSVPGPSGTTHHLQNL